MLGPNYHTKISEILLTEYRYPEETEEGPASVSSKDASKTGFPTGSWGWNQDHDQGLQQLGPKMNKLHTLAHVEVGYCWCLACEIRVNVWLCNKVFHWPSASKFINLIPNHHTRITRTNAYLRFRVYCVIRWNNTWKRRPLPTMQEGCRNEMILSSPQSCMPHQIHGMAWVQQSE